MKHNGVFRLLSLRAQRSNLPVFILFCCKLEDCRASIKTIAARNDRKRKAFTLVEILVVIVIIVSLMALLFPAILAARNFAKAVACSANMGRLTTAIIAYESVKETFPYGCNSGTEEPPGGYPGLGQYDRKRWWWFNYIDISSGNSPGKPGIIKCAAKHLTNTGLQGDVLCGNYGVNQSICKDGTGKKSQPEFAGSPLAKSDVRNPSQTLLIVDSGYSIITWQHASSPPPGSLNSTTPIENTAYIPGLSINSQRKFLTGQQSDAINGRHPDKTVNIGFADGSVSRVKAEELLVNSKGDSATGSDIRWKPK